MNSLGKTSPLSTKKSMLKLKNISKTYHGNGANGRGKTEQDKHIVLQNLDLDIKEGEFLTVVGPSGCGKSTLLNIISGIDSAYNGDIIIDGKPILESKYSDRVVVFQDGALFPWLTVYENIEFGLKVAKLPSKQRKEIVIEYLDKVQLSNFKDAYIHQLSGGMKQRVAIARALALNPKILLMDEPFAALDVQTRRMLYKQLLKIHEDTKKTIIFITHNINEAVALGDRVILMSPKLANIKREFVINLPRPRQIDHPIIETITNEIISESQDLVEKKIPLASPLSPASFVENNFKLENSIANQQPSFN